MKQIPFVLMVGALLAGCSDEPVVEVRSGMNLTLARDTARTMRANGEIRPIKIVLNAGRYELDRPLELDGRDSGTIWCAAPGAKVRVSGGMIVEAEPEPVADRSILELLPEKARSKVVQYDLKKLQVTDWGDYLYNFEHDVQNRVAKSWGQGEFTMGSHRPPKEIVSAGRMELFVDDRPLTVARSAKGVVYHVDKLLGELYLEDDPPTCKNGKFTYKGDIPAAWAKEPDAHVCGCWCHDWAEQHQKIVKLDLAKREMELSKPDHQYYYSSGAYFFGFNMLCELDEPGEWYIHRASRKLVVWMPEGKPGNRRVELSMASRLFELTGATNVVMRGITFEACRNSAVRMEACEGCALEDCVVRNVGQHALIVEDGHRCGARRCEFYGMGGGGAWLVDGNRKKLVRSDHFAEDCDIHDFGRWNRMYRPGVCLAGVGMRAVRNRIHDSPHSAILYFGCYLNLQSNEIYRVCSGSRDCGAFYTGRSWTLRGNTIRDNYLHDIIGLNGSRTRTIYLDDSMAQVEISGNRFERCTWAIFIGGARENVITNNVFIDCPYALYVDSRGMGWQKKHVQRRIDSLKKYGECDGVPFYDGPYAKAFPAITKLPGPNPFEPVLNVVAHNKFIRGDATWIRKYAPKLLNDPRWWRSGNVLDEELVKWGTFEDNEVDNSGMEGGK